MLEIFKYPSSIEVSRILRAADSSFLETKNDFTCNISNVVTNIFDGLNFSYAGIHVKIVSGYSKSAGYRPGMPFHDARFRNSWTCVLMDGSWRFVDTHWGARHVTTPSHQQNDPFNVCYELDDFFFLCDPEDSIYMHFPDEQEWQLLHKPISIEDFIRQPVLKSHFFHYGLEFVGDMSSIIDTDTGLVEIVLRMRNISHRFLTFNTRLESNEEELEGYDIYHRDKDEIIFNVSLPHQGIFYFSIFACDTCRSETYNSVCSFQIRCTNVPRAPLGRFPSLPDGYGKTNLAKELGLSVDKFDGYYIVCNEEKLKMNIRFDKSVKISHRLVCGNQCVGQQQGMDQYAFQRYRDDRQVSYLIRFLEQGIYAFSIFAAEKASKAPVLECVCRHLIQCNSKPTSAQLGPYPKNLQCWLRCRLHEPTTGILKLNKNIKFKVEVGDCNAVAVIIGGQWFYLTPSDEDAKTWEGIAYTGQDENVSVFVYAKYNNHDFLPLLQYGVTN